jgi:tRNA/tmRNA/rRNA uracil-C5-methylase (TrmA/RlmC/RlmD family)
MERVTAQVEKIQSPVVEKYRNKVVLFYSNDGFGYMKKESTSIVPHESCVLNEDIFDKIANKTAELLKGTSVRALFMRKSSDNSQVMVCPILRNEQDLTDFASKITDMFPQIKTVLYAVNDDVTLLSKYCVGWDVEFGLKKTVIPTFEL